MELAVGVAGCALMVEEIGDLGPSQPLTVWLTYHVVVPATAEEGFGVTPEPVPPIATVYQSKF